MVEGSPITGRSDLCKGQIGRDAFLDDGDGLGALSLVCTDNAYKAGHVYSVVG
jgi:hypothetical protein